MTLPATRAPRGPARLIRALSPPIAACLLCSCVAAPVAPPPAPPVTAPRPAAVAPPAPPPAAPAPPAAHPPPPAPPPAPARSREAPARRVGILLATRGPAGAIGVDARLGAELCMEEGPGGDRGFRMVPVFREEASGDPAAALETLVGREGAVAVVGPLLSESAERLLPALAGKAVAVLSPTACSPRLEGRSPLFLRTCMTLDAFGESLASYAAGRLGSPAFVIALPASPYGRALAGAFRRGLAAAGGRVLLSREFPPGAPDAAGWAGELREAVARNAQPGGDVAPDGIFFAGSAAEAGAILPRLGAIGLLPRSTAVVGGSALDTPEFPRLAGSWAEGALVADGFFAGSDAPTARAFVERFRARHGTDPGPAAAQACAAVEVLAEAMRGGAATREQVAAALKRLGTVETVLGRIRAHPGGRVERRPFLMTVSGGRLVEVGTP